jgi:hypothetical protein
MAEEIFLKPLRKISNEGNNENPTVFNCLHDCRNLERLEINRIIKPAVEKPKESI